ncbi:MAG: extracellular solute-binding protein [Promicromonosporaceae bacterium]|nr:extracellular solute-binding protein [Promicromonosporaceae bacterium]
MKTKLRAGGIVAMAAALALVVAGCGDDDNGGADPTPTPDETTAVDPTPEPDETDPPAVDRDPVTVTWWHNGVGEPLYSFWQGIADEFVAANPHVTVNIEAIQNETLRNDVLPTAFQGGNAPDLFQSWGGGELADWHAEGLVMNLSNVIPDTVAHIGAVGNSWAIDGAAYGLPFTFGPSGFWVNTEVWESAGLDSNNFPATLDELFEAWNAIADAGYAPVALGGQSGWPVGHWWYWSAVKTCSSAALLAASNNHDWSDPCWVQAGENMDGILTSVNGGVPFNQGWLATSAQEGATSASGLVVTGMAAMQLMGVWDIGVMGGIYNEANDLPSDTLPPAFLSWFPFPNIPGGGGDANLMGGGDGFSVHTDAPVEAAELLAFILSDSVQQRYAAMDNIPTNPNAFGSIPAGSANLLPLAALENAGFVQLWLDAAYGGQIGTPMNNAITAFIGGQGTPQDVVDAIVNAAG